MRNVVEKLRGKFITFEGCEGVGKTTQSKLLVEYLGKNHVDAIWTREPGGCITAEKIRGLLLTGNTDKFDGITEMALMYAARLEHTEKKIKPYLKDGFVVVSDRYFDSTMAYQGYGQGVALERIEKFRECLIENFKPDLTIILDLDIEEGLKRANKRGNTNRFEDMNIDFHKRVRNGFLEIAKKNKDRVEILEVTDKDIEEIHELIKQTIIEYDFK